MTGAAFGQVPDGLSFSSWGRADFVAAQGVFPDEGDATHWSGVGSGWGPAYMGLSFAFTEADGRIGGAFDLSGGASVGDNLNIWAKPFGSDILEVKVGKITDGRFRGPGTDNEFQGFIGGPGANGDAVFQRFQDGGSALFVSKPIPALSLFVHLRTGGNTLNGIKPWLDGGVEAKDVYKKIQAGLAYDIDGIGLARAQWVGNTMDITLGKDAGKKLNTKATGQDDLWEDVDATDPAVNAARIEAAFKLTAIEALGLDVGLKIPLPVEDKDTTWQDNFKLSAVGSYTAGDFGATLGLYGAFGGGITPDGSGAKRGNLAPTFNLIATPTYYVTPIDATLGLDAGFKVAGKSSEPGSGDENDDNSFVFGLGAHIKRDLGKGFIKTGLAVQLPASVGDDGTKGQNTYLTWPIILQLAF